MWPSGSIGLEEERDQAEDERVEGNRLREREAQPADRLELVLHLGLAGDRFDLLAEDETDADSGSDRAETGANAERDRLSCVGDGGEARASLRKRDQRVNHGTTPFLGELISMTLGGGSPDVDGGEDREDERLKGRDQDDRDEEEGEGEREAE